MPKRDDIQSILILGAGPIIIGQACEFDYSGAQACKALREEGYRVILVNSNPATIMTDPAMADATYIEPVEWRTVAKIIEQERPDALLPTMGGQTALNCALDLAREGVLKQFGVEMIGATADAIDKAEDRHRFDVAMKAIGLDTARSGIAHSWKKRCRFWTASVFLLSFVRHLPWAVPVAALRTTAKSLSRFVSAVWIYHPPMNC
jgi:carbamoyl-phosphate synthase large subunit